MADLRNLSPGQNPGDRGRESRGRQMDQRGVPEGTPGGHVGLHQLYLHWPRRSEKPRQQEHRHVRRPRPTALHGVGVARQNCRATPPADGAMHHLPGSVR